MKNLANKFREGVKKLVLPVAATAILSTVAIQDVDAQRKQKFPENHDNGAEFYQGKGNSEYSLEEKIFYNQVTGKDERFYMQYIDKEKYADDLDIAALDFYKTIPKMNLKTGEVSELTSEDGMYIYFPEKLENGKLANSIVIDNLHIGDWCEDQIRDRAGVTKGINYISISDLKNLLPEHERLKTGDGRDFIVLTVAKENQVEGKTNHYLVEVDDKHEGGFNPVTKKPIIYGSIYRGNLEKGPVTVDAQPGNMAGELGIDETFKEQEAEETKEEDKKEPSKLVKQLGIEVGAGTNKEVTAGIFGNVPVTPWLRAEAFGNYSVVKGESYIPKEPEIISESEQSLIGPGTYKTRVDETTTSFSDKGIAEAGVGITFIPNKKIEFPLAAGIKFSKRTKTIDGKSTISFERNQEPLGEPQVITNTLEYNKFAYPLFLSGGIRYNISKNLSLEALYNRVENQNTGKINLRLNF